MGDYRLEILTPNKQFFDGYVSSAVFPASNGEFCVLKGHQPTVAELDEGTVRYKVGDDWNYAYVFGAFAEIRPDEVIVFAIECVNSDEVEQMKKQQENSIVECRIHHEEDIKELNRDLGTHKMNKR